MTILVIDVGTSGVRAAAVRPDATIAIEHHRPLLPSTPEPGLVEFDAAELARVTLELARTVLGEIGPVDGVGITNQRASTIVWDRASGVPVGPGIGWQDLRTVGTCLVLQADGIRVAPNASATKLGYLLDLADPERARDLCFGTVDAWLAWQLSEGAVHATDASNAAVTGLLRGDAGDWDDKVLDALRIPRSILPSVVDTSGVLGPATALEGAPPIAALIGDQQSSLAGQGCVAAGDAKITFGTGGMLDLNLGGERPRFERQGEGGCFPIVAWRRGGELTWGVEAVDAVGGHQRRVAARRPRHHRQRAGEPRGRGSLRHRRRRRLRPRPPRARRATVGLRRTRHPAGPHPRQRASADRAGRARGRGPARRRPRRVGGDRHRACGSRRCGSTGG